MWLAAILGFSTVLLFIFKQYIEQRKIHAFAKTLPGPKPWPIVGNGLLFAVPQKEIINSIQNAFETYGSPARYWLGPDFYIFIDKPEDIQAIFTSTVTTHKGKAYDIIAESIGYGIVQESGLKHRIQRKHMILPLRQKVLDNYIHVFDQKGAECAKSMEKYIDKEPFDVIEIIERASTALVVQMILGYEININDSKNYDIIHHVNMVYRSISERTYKAYLHPYWIYRFSKHYRIQKEGVDFLLDYFSQIVTKRRAELKHVVSDITDDQTISLDLLLLAEDNDGKKIFSDVNILEQIINLFTASEDTLGTITSFSILMLAMHKDIQEKVWKEQVSVLGSDGDPAVPILPHHLENMTYLHMVIQEVLRLFPIAMSITRLTTDDFKMGEIIVPKNTNLLISIFRVQRDEKIWPEPNKFNPMRFTPEEIAKRHPYSYVPFSGGARGCIGKKFAIMGLKSILSHMIRNYILHSDWTMDDLVLDGDISIRSTYGYKVKISKRMMSN